MIEELQPAPEEGYFRETQAGAPEPPFIEDIEGP